MKMDEEGAASVGTLSKVFPVSAGDVVEFTLVSSKSVTTSDVTFCAGDSAASPFPYVDFSMPPAANWSDGVKSTAVDEASSDVNWKPSSTRVALAKSLDDEGGGTRVSLSSLAANTSEIPDSPIGSPPTGP